MHRVIADRARRLPPRYDQGMLTVGYKTHGRPCRILKVDVTEPLWPFEHRRVAGEWKTIHRGPTSLLTVRLLDSGAVEKRHPGEVKTVLVRKIPSWR